MRIILDLAAQAGGTVPSATLQVRPDQVDTAPAPQALDGSITAMDAGAARIDDGAPTAVPTPASEQVSVGSALNAGPAPGIIESTDRPATTSPSAPALSSEGSAGSAPIVIDEFEVPAAVARRIR